MKAFIKQVDVADTAQKMKFSIKDFFSKCDQIRIFLQIWSHVQKKSLIKISFFVCSVFFSYPLKKSENQKFSDVFKDCRKRPAAWNGLMRYFGSFSIKVDHNILLVYPFEWHFNIWHLIDPLECHANSYKPVETTKR